MKAPHEIYIRKLRYEDAKKKLLQEIESLFLKGAERVRIIHGVGEHILRKMAVQELSRLDYIEIIEDENIQKNIGQLEIRLLLPDPELLRQLRSHPST